MPFYMTKTNLNAPYTLAEGPTEQLLEHEALLRDIITPSRITLPTTATLLGFDFGMKYIGVAIGQCLTSTARPLGTIQAQRGIPIWSALTSYITTWSPTALVVGIPLNMDGTVQWISHHAADFMQSLQARYHLPVYSADERLTTKIAREQLSAAPQGIRSRTHNTVIHGMAAQCLLQAWLHTITIK